MDNVSKQEESERVRIFCFYKHLFQTSRLQVRGRYHSICDSRCSRLKHSDEGWDELKLVVPSCVPIDATEIEVYVTVSLVKNVTSIYSFRYNLVGNQEV